MRSGRPSMRHICSTRTTGSIASDRKLRGDYRSTSKGEAVVLEEWRAHQDVLAMRGLWCSGDRVRPLGDQIARVASGSGLWTAAQPTCRRGCRPGLRRSSVRGPRPDRGPPPGPDRVGRGRSASGSGSAAASGPSRRSHCPRADRLGSASTTSGVTIPTHLARYLVEDRLVVAQGAGGCGRIYSGNGGERQRNARQAGGEAVRPGPRNRRGSSARGSLLPGANGCRHGQSLHPGGESGIAGALPQGRPVRTDRSSGVSHEVDRAG
jgi:hypothetical protein